MSAPVGGDAHRVEGRIARDLARHGLYVAPAVILLAGLARGIDGAASAAVGLVLVVANFGLSAAAGAWSARRSPATIGAVALGGFIVRMALLLLAMLALDALFGWVDVVVLALTVFVTHLGLLAWELRSVSLTLAVPGLRRDRAVPQPRTVAAGEGVTE